MSMKRSLLLLVIMLSFHNVAIAQNNESDIKKLIESNRELREEVQDINLRIDRFSASKSVSSTFFVIAVAAGVIHYVSDQNGNEFLYASAISGTVSYVILQFSGAGMRKKHRAQQR